MASVRLHPQPLAPCVGEGSINEGAMNAPVLDRHIEITPGIAGGKPRIAGHRITVQNIVIWHEFMGKSVDEIATEYGLSLADVYAALAYYFDHQAEIAHSIQADELFVAAQRQQTPSLVQARSTNIVSERYVEQS